MYETHKETNKKNVVKQKCIYSVELYWTGKLKSYTLQSLLLSLTGLPSDSSCSLQEVHILLSKPHKQSFLFMSLSFSCHSSDPLCTFVHMRWFCTSHVQNEGRIPVYHIHEGTHRLNNFLPPWSALIKTKLKTKTKEAKTTLDKVTGKTCIISCFDGGHHKQTSQRKANH